MSYNQEAKFSRQIGQFYHLETRSNFILHYTKRLFQETNTLDFFYKQLVYKQLCSIL